MSDKGFTDETIEAAIRNAKHGSSREPLAWAAGEYLKAKAVIEWYGAGKHYCIIPHSMNGHALQKPDDVDYYATDRGEVAREYLEKLNQNKGDK